MEILARALHGGCLRATAKAICERKKNEAQYKAIREMKEIRTPNTSGHLFG